MTKWFLLISKYCLDDLDALWEPSTNPFETIVYNYSEREFSEEEMDFEHEVSYKQDTDYFYVKLIIGIDTILE